MKLLIFCVESKNSKQDSDGVYIHSVLKKYYELNNQIKVKFIYMNGKNNALSQSVRNNIKNTIKQLKKVDEYCVCYVCDKDRFDFEVKDKRYIEELETYCNSNEYYELIWMNRDVEDVFLGETIHKSEKVKKASQFARSNAIESVPMKLLSIDKPSQRHTSNILCVLDKYLVRK